MRANYSVWEPLKSLIIVNKCFFFLPLCLSQMDFYFESLRTKCFPLAEMEYWLLFAAFLRGLTAEEVLVWCHVLPSSTVFKLQGVCLYKCSARTSTVLLFSRRKENLSRSPWCWWVIEFSFFPNGPKTVSTCISVSLNTSLTSMQSVAPSTSHHSTDTDEDWCCHFFIVIKEDPNIHGTDQEAKPWNWVPAQNLDCQSRYFTQFNGTNWLIDRRTNTWTEISVIRTTTHHLSSLIQGHRSRSEPGVKWAKFRFILDESPVQHKANV